MQLEELKVAVRDDVVTGETIAGLKAAGPFGATPTKSNNDADKFVTLYHLYDGRELRLPMYQAEDRLKRRFLPTSETPEEYHGLQVWHIRSVGIERPVNEFQCRLSRNSPEDMLADMKKAGLVPTCRKRTKDGGFATQFEADEHFRIKHPRRWQAYQRWLNQNSSKTQAESMNSAVQALLTMAQASQTSKE